MGRNLRLEAFARLFGALEGGEALPDARLHRLRVEIADRDDGHQVRPVPVLVEVPQPLRRDLSQHLRIADRQPLRVARAVEAIGDLGVAEPRSGTPAAPPLLDHDATLEFDLLVVQGDGAGPVLEHQERLVQDVRVVRRHLQHVDRLVEAGVRVDVRPEAHADALQVVEQLRLFEVLRAVERHVLDEVGQPELVVVLEHRTGTDDEAQEGAVLGPAVLPHVVPEAVVELSGEHGRILGKDLVQLVRPFGQQLDAGVGLLGVNARRHEAGDQSRRDGQQACSTRVRSAALSLDHRRFSFVWWGVQRLPATRAPPSTRTTAPAGNASTSASRARSAAPRLRLSTVSLTR